MGDRQQIVQIDQYKSGYMDITCGVPQGLILGPTLFIMYINEICKISELMKFVLFANDTNVMFSGQSGVSFGTSNWK